MQKIPPKRLLIVKKAAPAVYLMADDKTLQRIYAPMYKIKEDEINEIIEDFNALLTPEHVRSVNKNATFNKE